MDLRGLHTLLTVADTGSFLQASRQLFLTPASVMNQVNKLEKLTGVKLLTRTTQGVCLTPAGESFCEDARKIIALADEAVEHAQRIAAEKANVIRIGSSLLRPAARLIHLCEEADAKEGCPFQFHLVAYEDDPDSLHLALDSLGRLMDCIVSPCDSIDWQTQYNILLLEHIPCRVAVPRAHPLAKKEMLTWKDLENQEFILIQRGDSPVLNRMRDDILTNHPRIRIRDAAHKYDAEVFNECLRKNCLMETLDIWTDAHPSLVTLPMEWEYTMPYGIIYAKNPDSTVQDFIAFAQAHLGNSMYQEKAEPEKAAPSESL